MSNMLIAKVKRNLKGFTDPDTASQFECRVRKGSYECLEYRPKFPGPDTDYAKLDMDTLADGDTWVCTRWKNDIYARVVEQEAMPEQVELPERFDDGVDESKLVSLLETFRAFRYTPRGARYPFPLQGISVKQSPPHKNNCCTFVEALVIKAWLDNVPDFRWDAHGHAEMMILGSDLFSPVNVLIERGIALSLSPDAPPHPWSVVQGWSANNSGHSFIIVAHHGESDRILTLESNSAYGLDGVGFRKLGGLREFQPGQAPSRWWENPRTPTWKDIRRWYPKRRLCALKINNVSWPWVS